MQDCRHSQRIDDVYALGLLQPLLDGPYLPFTNSALRPLCLTYILNDIVVNARQTILEFGSGISTIMMGRLIKKNNTGAKVLSVEHNRGWADLLQAAIRNEQLEDILTVLHAPLKPSPLAIGSNQWYEIDVDTPYWAKTLFDMVVIDGPPAYEMTKEKARYPALPFIVSKLSGRCCLFLDDADREGEKEIIRRWEKEFGFSFRMAGGSLAYATRGENFNLDVF